VRGTFRADVRHDYASAWPTMVNHLYSMREQWWDLIA
jgi:hypothetical protein